MIMKKVFFILALFALLALDGMAQTSDIRHSNQLIGKYSVAREWTPTQTVAFAFDNSRQGYFVLDNASTNVLRRARIPYNVRVTDFRILNDSVFFCGYYPYSGSGPKNGIVGFFDIQQMFFGGDVIHYSPIASFSSYYGLRITEPQRMDLYQDGGSTHIVLVGKTETDASAGFAPATTVCDAAFGGSGWDFHFYVNKPQDRIYTDIAASSQYVVAVGTDSTKTRCMVDVFYTTPDIINHRMDPNRIFYLDAEIPIGDVLVEDIADSRFALAYQCKTSSGYGSTVKVFDIDNLTPSLGITHSLVRQHVASAEGCSGWQAKGLFYDAASDDLVFLQNTRMEFMSGIECAACRFDIGLLPLGMADIFYVPSYWWNRIDRNASPYYHFAGHDGTGQLNFWRDLLNSVEEGCAVLKPTQYLDGSVRCSREWYHWDRTNRLPYNDHTYTPVIDQIELFTNCSK